MRTGLAPLKSCRFFQENREDSRENIEQKIIFRERINMKANEKYVECADCGRKIFICNAHYINGKPYGYNCYRKQLALLYKQWEDEKNTEYSAKCFAAMQVFEGKKSNFFHDSICKQWKSARKLTARQLEYIIKGFTNEESINFWIIWQQLSNNVSFKCGVPSWVEHIIGNNFKKYMDNEAILNCLLYDPQYKRYGFHFCHDIDDDLETIFISRNGRKNIFLKEHIEDEYIEVLKVVEGVRK